MNWSALPDIIAIALLICAFTSTGRRKYSPAANMWLIAWLMIALHFFASLFNDLPGVWGTRADTLSIIALIWAGVLFQTAVIPYRKESSSRWMMLILLTANTLYMTLLLTGQPQWTWTIAATLFAIGPLAITLFALPRYSSRYRWSTVTLNLLLAVFLLVFQNRPGNGPYLAINAVMAAVFLGCAIKFFFAYRRATAGAFITIAGFITWASVFVLGPSLSYFFPQLHVEAEVWNLPKFIVAIGMILLLLEDQIEHNKYLALHDELTGLPNRRLFQDRLTNALERARRSGAQTALLLVDLDHFKKVNDTLGHHVGDLLLERVGTICTGRVRRSDTVARTGGDEFSVILEEPTCRVDAEHVSHSLIELLEEPLQLDDHTVRIGASVGIAIYPDDAADMESLCIAADLRMYENKHQAPLIGNAIPAH
ncbi:MAG: diguanylate cyclase domain-containing protein [Terracidiphilus sp.]